MLRYSISQNIYNIQNQCSSYNRKNECYMIKYILRLEKQAEILAFATIMFPFVVAIGVTAENEISELYIAI